MKISTTKQFFTLIISLLSGFTAIGQTAITITAADMPVPTGPYNLDEITGLVSNQAIASNSTWDFSAFNGNLPNSVDYFPETIPFFTDAGVDAYRLVTKTLTPGFGYYIYQELDFNDDAVDDIAVDVPAQGYTLQPFTGNIDDSLLIPAQSYIYDTYRRLIQFPITANSTWSSSSRRVSEMYIHVPAFGLNYAPIQQAYTWVRNDAILGWGKMRVYTPDGPSIQYDVLVNKITEYATDSMYLNGVPAPTQLLTAFGITQGQKTNMGNRYSFYRKGSFGYLATLFYGADDSYTDLESAYVATDDIETQGPSAIAEQVSYSTVLYPNPSTGSEINIMVMGGGFELSNYEIYDAMGKLVKQGQIEAQGSDLKLRMDEPLPNGNYFIQLKDKQLRSMLTEQFEVIN